MTSALRDIHSTSSHSVDMEALRQTVTSMEADVSAQKHAMADLREGYHAVTERISSVLEKVPTGGLSDSSSMVLDDVADAESTDLVKALAGGSRKQVSAGQNKDV